MPKQTECMSSGLFVKLLAHKKWNKVDDMIAVLDRADYWSEPEVLAEMATAKFKRTHCRSRVKNIRRADGRKAFVNVIRTEKNGEKVHLYKQQALFDVNDYRYVSNYHKGLGIHHMAEANRFARDCRIFLGKQLPLPFPGREEEMAEALREVPDIINPVGPAH